jgi:hypothetical protein
MATVKILVTEAMKLSVSFVPWVVFHISAFKNVRFTRKNNFKTSIVMTSSITQNEGIHIQRWGWLGQKYYFNTVCDGMFSLLHMILMKVINIHFCIRFLMLTHPICSLEIKLKTKLARPEYSYFTFYENYRTEKKGTFLCTVYSIHHFRI